jgi:sulfite reductase alpha subunit-like flavoprotein
MSLLHTFSPHPRTAYPFPLLLLCCSGLGDSNYDTYQGFPKKLFARLTELGAKPFLPRREADEATGYKINQSINQSINTCYFKV